MSFLMLETVEKQPSETAVILCIMIMLLLKDTHTQKKLTWATKIGCNLKKKKNDEKRATFRGTQSPHMFFRATLFGYPDCC